MIVWFRHLPQIRMDVEEWKPFIQHAWFRKHFMKVVYLLMVAFFLAPIWFGVSLAQLTNFPLLLIILLVFVIHEALHMLVIHKKGDMSLTFRGIYFWIHTDAILSKKRYLVFMSLPFIGLSIIPAITSSFVSGDLKVLLLFISWFNLIISASDIVNSILILLKPNQSVFCRGYYRRMK
ncbi:DUF3267 domain-containing protein [Psychrobacillus sp. L3]|uniref:DUF3267 domain-containing protein n=1 Tax=Psychrobacillus sp. L3 TaxID=3236891 RepID=UPI0036F3372E